ncbi:uncharacterized protein LOC108595523 [Drosophila busckii]|uniref:uncharacterized protein LOC108595523 n=1 Tax=Drosophila busckii TaxID=30019 RepID=UPI00083F2F1A|nr:uncharacterized protein LOC108595523 [Drosophila busckii]
MYMLWLCICCSLLLLPEATLTMRIKRSEQAAAAVQKTETNNTTAAAATTTAAATTSAAATTTTTAAGKSPALAEAELLSRLHHNKRRMALLNESLLPKVKPHAHSNANNPIAAPAAAPAATAPFVYYNKLVSPDGKQQLKEFQLLAPNVVIESLQRDLNYGPELGGIFVLNAEQPVAAAGHGHHGNKPKHLHAHKSHKSALGMPPLLYLLQQLMQSSSGSGSLEFAEAEARRELDNPFYQFLDNVLDNPLRNAAPNEFAIERLLSERELTELQKQADKDKDKDKTEQPAVPQDELIVSCPIHHEHHANNNGQIIDDDVVLVNECHIV